MSDSSILQPNPERLEELMSGYVLDVLTPEETVEFEQYLCNDLALIKRMNQMQEMAALLARSQTAPSELRAKLQKISQATEHPPQPRPIVQPQPPIAKWKLLGAIGAMALLILGIDNMRLRYQLFASRTQITTLQASEAAHEAEEYTFDLKAKEAGSNAEAIVVFDADEGVLFMGAKNLPPLPADEAYHLWAFTKDNQKILCGQFNTDDSNQLTQQFSVRPEDYQENVVFMRISREPKATPPDGSRRVLVLTSEL